MLMRTSWRLVRGYSLVEAMVVLIIMAVLLAKGIPAFQQTIASMRVRDTAESIQNGIRLAQGTAIRQNVNVYFRVVYAPGGVLANCSLQSNWVDAATHVTNWTVTTTDLISNASPSCNYPVPATPGPSDDTGLMQVATVDQGGRVGVATMQYKSDGSLDTPPTQVCFNSMGTFCKNMTMPIRFTVVDQANINNPNNAGRTLQVCAMPGGVKMCDPSLFSTTDPMACAKLDPNTFDPNKC